MSEQDDRPAQLRTARLEAFSAGVFAVAITLLVLEISVPEGAGDDLLGAVLDQWPSYLAHVVSFATVGAIWLAHTAVTEFLDHADSLLMRLNLLPLMVVSFLLRGDDRPGTVPSRRRGDGLPGHCHLLPGPDRHVAAAPRRNRTSRMNP